MTPLVIRNGTLLTFGERCDVFRPGAVRIENGVITAVGKMEDVDTRNADVVDAGGAMIVPGLIDAHTHLYGTLARGIDLPGAPAETFREILERLWWRFDELLDHDSIRWNALAGMTEALRCGVTTLVDHHSSPNAAAGSLDVLALAAAETGIRLAAAYEVSDRDGPEKCSEGLEENRRFARRLDGEPAPLLAGAIGGHASFTLSAKTLSRLVALADETGRPIHLHMDEGTEDGEAARAEGFRSTAHRLADLGVLRKGAIAGHAVHVDGDDIALLAEREVFVTHQVLSNGANAVGRSPVPALLDAGVTVCLGSDGMCASLAPEALAAGAVHRMAEEDRSIPFDLPCTLAWIGNARLASTLFDPAPGELRPGRTGDAVIVDYRPPTPVHRHNAAAHWLLGVLHAPVEQVFVAGRRVYGHGRFAEVDQEELARRCDECAVELWRRFEEKA